MKNLHLTKSGKCTNAVVTVPLEPTEKMVNAGFAQIVREGVSADSVRAIYRAMIAKIPYPLALHVARVFKA